MTSEVLGGGNFNSDAVYTCGPLGEFYQEDVDDVLTADERERHVKTCQWNGGYAPLEMNPCRRKFT